jgi:hypothetical protein
MWRFEGMLFTKFQQAYKERRRLYPVDRATIATHLSLSLSFSTLLLPLLHLLPQSKLPRSSSLWGRTRCPNISSN